MRLSRLAAIGGASLVALASAGTAMATSSVTPSTGLQDGNTVQVSYTGTSNIVYITQCGKDGNVDPTFDFAFDCYTAVGINPAVINGSATAPFQVFKGADPQFGLYTCDEANPCYIRFSPGFEDNTGADEFQQITFAAGQATTTSTAAPTTTTAPGTDVPEAPFSVMLPVSAAVGLGGAALYMTRRRRAA